MKKMTAVLGLLVSLTLTGTGYAQPDRSAETANLLAGLTSSSGARRIQAAKLVTQAGLRDQGLYETIAALLKQGYAAGTEDEHVDEMSWLCKALAASGEPRYRELLQEVAARALSPKLQHYARQSEELIEEYAERSRVLNETESWDAELSAEENRLVNMLSSDDPGLKRDAAKNVVRSLQVHPRVYEVIAAELLEMLAAGNSGTLEIDTMAWLCKALAGSGESKYLEPLKQVEAGTQNLKLKSHVAKAIKQIN